MTVRRIFVEKRQGFDIAAQQLCDDLKETFHLEGLQSVRIIKRYDMEGLSEEEYEQVKFVVFAEAPVDQVYEETLPDFPHSRVFAVEYLPGQYDQTADSAAQCVQLVTQKERPEIATARVIVLTGEVSDADFAKIKDYCINAVESREASLEKPESLDMVTTEPADVEVLSEFNDLDETGLHAFMDARGFAMSFEDLKFCQTYFRGTEHRAPTITELRVIDTYWSDHCRHTTFTTAIDDVKIEDGYFTPAMKKAYDQYMKDRKDLYGEDTDRAVTLMDIAIIGMKALRKQGLLEDLDKSEEINACSIEIKADIGGRQEDWLVMFKNETHNHPTEIEPFGGAATCLGGAIRDPLSGRSYVYQAMRVTGAADPRRPFSETLPGKLPQKKITLGAAAGYSSYGNQIGLATGQVREVYHEGYMAKRMEIGAVIAAAPKENVVRERPAAGDIIVLVGGRTGRDGCGGATGSSKEHTEESLTTCGAEVQKGNPPTERKIQRLFRNPSVSRMIKRCNDFGAGGVAVAIGELADGLVIDLDAVKKKYKGLDGTELAISESQERMAVVLDPKDVEAFQKFSDDENLEATPVAIVTEKPRLIMKWRGKEIVQMNRAFLDTNGVRQHVTAVIAQPDTAKRYLFEVPAAVAACDDLATAWLKNLQDLNVCSQKGLAERFDSTIGGNSVLMPFGGKTQLTPSEGMVAKLPVLGAETNTATAMTFGLNPAFTTWSPFHGALYSVVEAAAKMVALGGDASKVRLTFQEYFESLGKDPAKWGNPFAALIGALWAQHEMGIPAIGGKDSMSGTFEHIHVPPTLAAFAVDVMKADHALSPEFKQAGSRVYLVPAPKDEQDLPVFAKLRENFARIHDLTAAGKVLSAQSIGVGGVAAAVTKMAFGNEIGFTFAKDMTKEELFCADYGTILLEVATGVDVEAALAGTGAYVLGQTTAAQEIVCNGTTVALSAAVAAYTTPLEKIFPTNVHKKAKSDAIFTPYTKGNVLTGGTHIARPRIFIPVFPGTNCEYDSARAWERAGADAETLIVRNLTPAAVEETVAAIVKGIEQANIIMLPGGFSGGDEPDGSGKFIAAMFRNPRIKEEVMNLLEKRDGLMLGICNGFQALIKLGLVPYGEIRDLSQNSPTLTHNTLGRHVSCMVETRVASNLSPWFNNVSVGDVHSIAVSHGEGRFVADEATIEQLRRNGQIATQYVDAAGNPSMDIPFNPNGSIDAIEGITSPDGRVLGKMGHSERIGADIAKNVPGAKDQQLFEAGVRYYK